MKNKNGVFDIAEKSYNIVRQLTVFNLLAQDFKNAKVNEVHEASALFLNKVYFLPLFWVFMIIYPLGCTSLKLKSLLSFIEMLYKPK